jgi:hypothetical protein
MIRSVAITGRTDTIDARIMGRQGGRWAQQTVRAALPTAADPSRPPPAVATPPPADPAETLRELTDLYRRGVLTDAELESLQAEADPELAAG